MFTLLFLCIGLGAIGMGLFIFAVKAAWSILKIFGWVLLIPLFLVILVLTGLIYIAIPFLVIAGVIGIIKLLRSEY